MDRLKDRMSHPAATPDNLFAQRLLSALQEARTKIETFERIRSEPLAIVGMGCRFPGNAVDTESFWRVLAQGKDAITQVPKDRWNIDAFYDFDPDVPGKMCTRYGGFLSNVEHFDAPFFGISRREAIGMDPQQRLLLEVCWEAIENAGISPAGLRGTSAGVFMGIGTFDYAALRYSQQDYEGIDPYFATGGVLSVAAGRLSYVLGLTGPSMVVDTACSSSLVAVHLACQSLRSRECDMALAGGVNVILLPELSINFSRAGMLSPDGRCKTFDASANGYVRGEGCGVVVLKRLSDAVAGGDRILALIRGSAVNQDGPSGGLTVPSGPAQEAVIRQALSSAGVEAGDVGYIEAHGTGTSLGDPIEMGSLAKVFSGRPETDPLVIGSVKTNIGHLEAAAGIAGLIKVVLSLQYGQIPSHLHFRNPNPHIAWEKLPFEIPIQPRKWPAGKKGLAGVSAFGASGTNAHVVLEEGPVGGDRASEGERPVHLLALSARGEGALKALAERYAAYIPDHPEEAISDVCYTANTGRSHFEERLAVIGATREEIAAGCLAYREGYKDAGVGKREKEEGARKIAFLFTGQGSQYAGMGRALYETAPGFRAVLDHCDDILKGKLKRPLLDVIYAKGEGRELDDTAYTQPALFAVEVALFELWKGWGIEPTLVMGHSVGEYAAACAAGVFSMEEGLKLVAERSRLMGGIGDAGGMAAVLAEEALVREAIRPYGGRVSVSAINGPRSIVISGQGEKIDAAVEGLIRQGIATRKLNVSQAFHSAMVEEVLPAFREIAARVTYERPRIGIVSNLTGGLMTDGMARPDYWVRHAREPVMFQAGMETLRQEGCGIFVEVGPNPVLLGMGRACLPDGYGSWLPSLRAGQNDWRRMLESLGELYVEGITPDWRGFDRNWKRNRVVLPTYPFQRQRYWIEGTKARRALFRGAGGHPLLGQRLPTAHRGVIFESQITKDSPSYLGDHQIYGAVVFPATGYVEMALAGGFQLMGSETLTIEGFSILQPLILSQEAGQVVQTILHPEAGGGYAFEIFSEAAPGQWRLHATGRLQCGGEDEGDRTEKLEELKARCTEPLSVADHYRRFREKGIAYGPGFQGIEHLMRGEGESLGFLRASGTVEAGISAYRLHPGLFDACLQTAAVILPAISGQENLLPVGMKRLRITSGSASVLWSHARLRGAGESGESHELDFCLYDETGRSCVQVEGFSLKRATREALLGRGEGKADAGLYTVSWGPVALPDEVGEASGRSVVAGRWVIFADAGGLGEKTAEALKARGADTALVYCGDYYLNEGDGRYRVNPLSPDDFRQLLEDVFEGSGCR
ncbi:MAG: type I polyketide synthase, partial [Pseudomonadota bacterium]